MCICAVLRVYKRYMITALLGTISRIYVYMCGCVKMCVHASLDSHIYMYICVYMYTCVYESRCVYTCL